MHDFFPLNLNCYCYICLHCIYIEKVFDLTQEILSQYSQTDSINLSFFVFIVALQKQKNPNASQNEKHSSCYV